MTPKPAHPKGLSRCSFISILAVLWLSVCGSFAVASTDCVDAIDANKSSDIQVRNCKKIYVGPDSIIEEFGAREAPYEGFLYLPELQFPKGYVEKSHHYTKTEYLLDLERHFESKNYRIQIIESAFAKFFEPKQNPIREFDYAGERGRVYSYPDHLTGETSIDLYWFKSSQQRLSISVAQPPTEEWSPEDLIALLKDMTPATGVPALVTPFPKPRMRFIR
jgi:hypothetical protein